MSASGISLVTSTGGPAELAEAARLAEEAGFASVWATEFYDRSATVALAAMALTTSKIELGSAIAYAFGRTPLVLAAEARDLDELSGGRITLGLGTIVLTFWVSILVRTYAWIVILGNGGVVNRWLQSAGFTRTPI